jgi:hypothetical protein
VDDLAALFVVVLCIAFAISTGVYKRKALKYERECWAI